MATFKVNKKRDYTVLSNTPLREKNMSLKAKGLLCLMLSLPEDWDYSIPGLCAICKENETAIRSALKELKEFGYLVVEKRYSNQTKSGHFEYIYNIYEEPVQVQQPEEDGIGSADDTSSPDTGNPHLENIPLNKSKDQSNTTHVSSKDDTFDKGHSHSSARPATPVSGKLFSSKRNTAKNSLEQRTNRFITACQREAIKKEFPKEVLAVLDEYFLMLGELNCLLPSRSIAEQLTWLKKVSADRQVAVVKNTISRGWKSLQYEAEANIASAVPSWDTAAPDAFQAKTEEQKMRNPLEGVPEDRIF